MTSVTGHFAIRSKTWRCRRCRLMKCMLASSSVPARSWPMSFGPNGTSNPMRCSTCLWLDRIAPSSRLRRSILSGPIDIDKMDYLVRDSQHCGVPYGRHFDRNRLMNSLIVNEAGDGLAITSKGRTAAEMMVFSRYVMFTEVYWHHAVRSATTMFARAFFELMPRLNLSSLFHA